MRRAYSYIRFSHPSQRKGDSKRRQITKTAAYCESKGWLLDDTVYADEGVSGSKGANAETGKLGEFLNLCRRGVIPKGSVLVLESLDRLTRQAVDDAYQLVRGILKLGIDIATRPPVEELYTANDLNNPHKVSGMLFVFAASNEKAKTLSDRKREVNEESRKNRGPAGKWCPLWLTLSAELRELKRTNDKTPYFELAGKVASPYTVIKPRGEIVKQIVKWAIEGDGESDILRKLNSNPKKYPPFSIRKPHWTKSYISKMLRSPALTGRFSPGIDRDGKHILLDQIWDNHFPRLITDADFYRLQSARKSRKANPGRRGVDVANLFSGILFNARDGYQFNRIVKDMPRLVSAAYRNGLEGHMLTLPYKPFENEMLEYLAKELKVSDLFSEPTEPKVDRVGELNDELDDLATRIEKVERQIENDPDLDTYLSALSRLKAKERKLKADRDEARAESVDRGSEANQLDDLQALLMVEDADNKTDHRLRIRAKIRQLIESIYVVIWGKKRSKFKSAYIEIFYRAGGFSTLAMRFDHGNTVQGESVYLPADFHDKWKTDIDVRKSIPTFLDEWGERYHTQFVQRRLKHPKGDYQFSK